MTQPKLSATPIAGLVVVLSLGCVSSHYKARDLPSQLRAATGAGAQRLRLDGLANLSGTTNRIGPADLLAVSLIHGAEEEVGDPLLLRVDEAGRVDVPMVGPVLVAGAEPAAAAERIAAAAVQRGVYVSPKVSLRFEERATYSISVLGAVNEPGVREVPRGSCDLVGAIAAAGGFAEDAGSIVEVIRSGGATSALAASGKGEVLPVSFDSEPAFGSTQPRRIDLSDSASRDVVRRPLNDRDVVVVRPREARMVYVSGLVETPDQYELPEDHDLRVLDAIAMAGGVTSKVADMVLVIRQREQADAPLVVEVSITEAKRNGSENLRLQPGDLVSVESTVATTIVGTMSDIFRISMGVGGNLTLF